MKATAIPKLALLAEEELVARSLESMPGRTRRVGSQQWKYTAKGERKARTHITVQGAWAVVDRPLTRNWYASRSRAMQRPFRYLDPRTDTASGARPVLPPGETRVWVRAERLLVPGRRDEPAMVSSWLGQAVADSATFAAGKGTADGRIKAACSGTPSPLSQDDVLGLCELGGWQAEARSGSGEVAVRLPAREGGTFYGIAFPDRGTVRVRVALEIARDPVSSLAGAAVGVAMLYLAGSVRLVRCTATLTDGRFVGGLEVRLQPPVDAHSLGHALAAVTVAHQQIAPELNALAGSDTLAGAYLRMQGGR